MSKKEPEAFGTLRAFLFICQMDEKKQIKLIILGIIIAAIAIWLHHDKDNTSNTTRQDKLKNLNIELSIGNDQLSIHNKDHIILKELHISLNQNYKKVLRDVQPNSNTCITLSDFSDKSGNRFLPRVMKVKWIFLYDIPSGRTVRYEFE